MNPPGMIGNPFTVPAASGLWTIVGYDELGFPCLDELCPDCESQALIISELGDAECLACSWRAES